MDRLTISVPEEFAVELAAFVKSHRYANRSEAIRDLVRTGLDQARHEENVSGDCIGILSYVYNHHVRELSRLLTETQHRHHDLQVATMHIHLDHENCLEVAVLRGDAAAVRDFSKIVIAERGVRCGEATFIPVSIDAEQHAHDGSGRGAHAHVPHGHARHTHAHIHPKR